jgi:hypothetical protein
VSEEMDGHASTEGCTREVHREICSLK